MGDTGTGAEVPNPYRAALLAAAGRAQPVATDCAAALESALTAMKAGAWVSPTGDTFFTALTGADRDAESYGNECVKSLRDAAAAQPEKVPPNSWQVHWRNLR